MDYPALHNPSKSRSKAPSPKEKNRSRWLPLSIKTLFWRSRNLHPELDRNSSAKILVGTQISKTWLSLGPSLLRTIFSTTRCYPKKLVMEIWKGLAMTIRIMTTNITSCLSFSSKPQSHSSSKTISAQPFHSWSWQKRSSIGIWGWSKIRPQKSRAQNYFSKETTQSTAKVRPSAIWKAEVQKETRRKEPRDMPLWSIAQTKDAN